MHTNRLFSARKFLFSLGAALSLLLLAGCDGIVLTNLTPGSLPENPSQIYTITLRVTPKVDAIEKSSITPYIVVDGQNHAMTKAALGEGMYEFDYQLPAGRDELAYYFLVNYNLTTNGVTHPEEAYTEITHAKIVRRYVLSLEVNRGPVGARVSVLGRGFTPQDVISLDGNPARTVFDSPNSLSFFVPALAAGRNYQVTVASASGNSPVGTFRIDGSNLSVSPTALTLRTGETQTISFTIPNPAPPGGLLLDLTTDIPESVIMPEVVVPQGQTTVTINVQGGHPGNGSLFLKGYGSGEVTVPITVTAK
ncbi:MAG: IPT/TIG domain-containing protein [Verrucomicrobia bacterium]|nr:IPT/TIG domain-containing protein [Verrucomicrobiota bacterium]